MPEKPRRANPEEQIQEKVQSSLSPEKILNLSPKEMADLFTELDKNKQLEEFLKKSADNPTLIAQFSYWEKWLEQDQRKLVDEIVAKKKETYGESEENEDSLPLGLEKRFIANKLKLIFSNLGAIQLTFGCSKGCPFCGFDAVPGVREHIPYTQLANLFQKYGSILGEQKRADKPFLYWASEPSDYASQEEADDKTYQDVHQLAETYAGYSPHITSKNAKDSEWLKFLGKKGNSRVSLYNISNEKTNTLENTIPKNVKRVGKSAKHIQGMGLTHSAETTLERGIGCFDGVLLTPRGLYNIFQVPISETYPQGQMVVPLENITNNEIKIGSPLKKAMRNHVVGEVRNFEADHWRKCCMYSEDGTRHVACVKGKNPKIVNVKSYSPEQIKQLSVPLLVIEKSLKNNCALMGCDRIGGGFHEETKRTLTSPEFLSELQVRGEVTDYGDEIEWVLRDQKNQENILARITFNFYTEVANLSVADEF